MTEEICPICRQKFAIEDSIFYVPKLPERNGFGNLVGAVHRRCLLQDERRDDLRSALSRSIAGAIHSPPKRFLAAVDGGALCVFATESKEYTIWNLADFIKFTIIQEAVAPLQESSENDTIPISTGLMREIVIGVDGFTSLRTDAGLTPMPSLPLSKLKRLLDPKGYIATAEAIVRVEKAEGPIPIGPSLIAWGALPSFLTRESAPVLLHALNRNDGLPGRTYFLSNIDHWHNSLLFKSGDRFQIKIAPKTTFSVAAVRSGHGIVEASSKPAGKDKLVDKETMAHKPVRANFG